MENLKTGDLLLFSYPNGGFLDSLIYWGTHSNYSHIGMVLKDPTFIHPALRGTYVWQSNWTGKPDPQDNKIKLGVQITPINELVNTYKGSGHCFYRTINCKNNFSDENLKKVHDVVYNKPYDICPLDWFEAFLKKDPEPQKKDRFWCSALVGYIYTECGILEKNTDWSILSPSDFSLSGENIKFCDGISLSDKEVRIF